jgi:hypothetical protein
MSITPDGPGFDQPRDDRGDQPRDIRADESFEPRQSPEQVKLPGIFLVIVAVINILMSLYLVFNGIMVYSNPKYLQSYLDQMSERFRSSGEQVPDFMQNAERFAAAVSTVDYTWAAVSILAALITLIGGIRMIMLRSYGLALTGAIIASIPCVSCCCGGGQGIGIWAIVVLARAEVKAMFR